MSAETALAVFAIVVALAFDFVNGFHDTANAVATVIYTRALGRKTAIAMSGLLNLLGALLVGTAVAQVITKIVPAQAATLPLVLSVLLGAIAWNIITWWRGLPVSSSHCLIGALFGAGIASQGWSGINWHELRTVGLALLISPIAGFMVAAVVAPIAAYLSGETKGNGGKSHARLMRCCQIFSSASVSFSHGGNDGQKTMGIITMILAANFAGYTTGHVPLWVMVAAASAMGLGTMIGGWRVIRTVGEKISQKPITPAQGFAAESSTAIVSLIASHFGAPISTTHTLNPAVAGSAVGCGSLRHLNFKMVTNILLAWLLTLPVAACASALIYMLLRFLWHA